MRPEDREETFRRGLEAWNSGDVQRALGMCSPDLEATAADWMNDGPFKGHEGFLRMNSIWDEAWDEWSYELLDVRAVGERHVVARVRVSGRGKGSGIEIDQVVGYAVEVDDDGLASYIEIAKDEERALEVVHEREVSN